MKVLIAEPRGFCAGVSRAVKTVQDCLDLFGPPVYIKHEIVHNKTVVEDLERRGAVTIANIEEIPEKSVVIFSAHGSAPEEYEIAIKKNVILIDATCPLVNKVHLEMHRFLKEGFFVIYIGHKNHQEGKGVVGEAKYHYQKNVPIIESEEDVNNLAVSLGEKLAFLTQTTLSITETEKIIQALKRKYPTIVGPPAKDICYATTNRQKAVHLLAKNVQLVLIVGSRHSSNSNRLVETAKSEGVPAYLIDSATDINEHWIKGVDSIGISAGASAPESQVENVIRFFKNLGASIESFSVLQESTKFPEPLELQNLKKKAMNKGA